MREIFILIPSLIPTGPVKGAIALANELAKSRSVTLVSFKKGFGTQSPISPQVKQVFLGDKGCFLSRLRAYRALLRAAGGRGKVASISSCFSADAVNLFCRHVAVTCSSVRGNLPSNYLMDHGFIGVIAAYVHMLALRCFDHVVAMSGAMAGQIAPFLGRRPPVIGNFIDEAVLEPFRHSAPQTGPFRFVFLASLSKRKKPLCLIKAIETLHKNGHDVHLDVIGKGHLREACEGAISKLAAASYITIHGQIENPYPLLAQADVMILPSLSEGISRAALEALHLGVPCVLRDVDGNAELIREGANGRLFDKDSELSGAMLKAAQEARARGPQRVSMLPDGFRQAVAARHYLDLVERS